MTKTFVIKRVQTKNKIRFLFSFNYFLCDIMANITLSEREVRIQKVEKMKKMGIHPFAQSFQKQHMIKDIITKYENKELRDSEILVSDAQIQVSTAGRVMLHRSHGKLAFAKILDSTGQIQLMFHRDNCKIIKVEKKQD